MGEHNPGSNQSLVSWAVTDPETLFHPLRWQGTLFGLPALLVLVQLHHVLVGWCFVGAILRYPNRTGKKAKPTHI